MPFVYNQDSAVTQLESNRERFGTRYRYVNLCYQCAFCLDIVLCKGKHFLSTRNRVSAVGEICSGRPMYNCSCVRVHTYYCNSDVDIIVRSSDFCLVVKPSKYLLRLLRVSTTITFLHDRRYTPYVQRMVVCRSRGLHFSLIFSL